MTGSAEITFDERSPGGWLMTTPDDSDLPLRICGEDGRELVRVEQDGSVVYESAEDLEDALRLIPQVWSSWRPSSQVERGLR